MVAGYALFETLLLLTYPLMYGTYPSVWGPIIVFAQFLTIPGMAVLFSQMLYGRYHWKRRAAIYFVTAPGLLLLSLLVALPLALVEKSSALFSAALYLCRIAILITVPILLFFISRESRRRSVALESSRWLAERQAGISARELRWRERGIRWSLWIPSVVVLTVFLFLPEVWGFLTHVQRPRAGQLPGYEVTIPPTWIIVSQYTNSLTGASGLGGIAVRGMALGFKRYLHPGDLPTSSWGVEIAELDEPKHWSLTRGPALARRDFPIGKATLTCLEYRPSWSRPTRADAEPLALIECAGSERLHASFLGERIHVPAFYGMLAGMTPGLPPEIK